MASALKLTYRERHRKKIVKCIKFEDVQLHSKNAVSQYCESQNIFLKLHIIFNYKRGRTKKKRIFGSICLALED